MSNQEYRPAPYSLLPPVVKNLLIINILFFLAGTVLFEKLGFNLNETLGLYFPQAENFKPYQYITYMFLHGSFGHIFMNMFAFWMFGTVLENFWGSKRFLLYFLATGIGAAFVQNSVAWYEISQMTSVIEKYTADPNPMDFSVILNKYGPYITQEGVMELSRFKDEWLMIPTDKEFADASVNFCNMLIKARMSVPTVGASGAVFGLLLAFGMLFPNALIYVFFAIPIKAKYFVIIYGLFELFAGVANNPGDQVAHFAHLGGMIFGFILIKLWKSNDRGPYY